MDWLGLSCFFFLLERVGAQQPLVVAEFMSECLLGLEGIWKGHEEMDWVKG